MNTIKTSILLAIAIIFMSCSNDDSPNNDATVSEDMEISMNENPSSDIISKIVATDTECDILAYSIVSQIPDNSIQINETTGEVFVSDINAFDYEQNTIVIAVIAISDGRSVTEITLTIKILDVNDNC